MSIHLHQIFIMVVLLFLSASANGQAIDSCAGRCDIDYDANLPCQCNDQCEEFSDCCTDYATECGSAEDSCAGRCNIDYDTSLPCQCNDQCEEFSDCCADYATECGSAEDSCVGRCNIAYDSSLPCQCNDQCEEFSDCCTDYSTECGTSDITDQEIADLSQQIWDADADKVTVSLSLQGQIADSSEDDEAPDPLFNSIPIEVTTVPIYQKLTALFDDYIRDDSITEDLTSAEWQEIDDFLSEAMKSDALQLTHDFLASKGVVSSVDADFQIALREIWYSLYVRSGALSSSGAEHVQVGEIKDDEISGLHNWVRFALLEQEGSVNYIGYVQIMDFGGTYVIRNPFFWDEYYKPIGGFFIGTSPAFDLSVYTLCFYARPDSGECTLNINGNDIKIQTYTMAYNDETLVGSAYPNY